MSVANASTPRIPRTVWMLGLVSLFMDFSSELIHSLLPIYLVSTMGLSVFVVGLIEGIAEATAQIVKVFSGVLSDRLRKRKALLLFGYGLAALSKPLFPLAQSAETVFTARFLDRIGKGIRGAPRDALIADVAPPQIRGACFGLRQTLDTLGALIGPVVAVLLMLAFSGNIQSVLWFACIPAGIAVVFILFGVQDIPMGEQAARANPVTRALIRQLSPAFWYVVVLGMVFNLARFSEAFLVLRAQDLGLGILYIPLVMGVMALFFTLSAYPVGRLSDRMNSYHLLGFSLVLLILADIVLAIDNSLWALFLGVALWGLHMGFSQGLLSSLVAKHAPVDYKATAFGVFNLASGVALLLASVLAGWAWVSVGPAATFYLGAVFSGVCLLLMWPYFRSEAQH